MNNNIDMPLEERPEGCREVMWRYSMGSAILDKDDPSRVLYRTQPYLLAPAAPYELTGDVPNVVFPCAALNDGKRVALYYGAADTVVGLAFGYIDEIIEFTKEEEKDITLAFRGSRNQRLIDMKKSLKEQEVIELEV